ncbi:hypothetical protein AVEN_30311-1 [Araneus ventricosus]|uniref:Uncharacterized protein n=1 Tax=Araneus ventricosus TaxID=182803 RepID=A0A4Y2KEX8_ARAVE|nr:hypothetical protein AVEN_30311-1 [Araneus ventricosus]
MFNMKRPFDFLEFLFLPPSMKGREVRRLSSAHTAQEGPRPLSTLTHFHRNLLLSPLHTFTPLSLSFHYSRYANKPDGPQQVVMLFLFSGGGLGTVLNADCSFLSDESIF